jgi:hypothetical protein
MTGLDIALSIGPAHIGWTARDVGNQRRQLRLASQLEGDDATERATRLRATETTGNGDATDARESGDILLAIQLEGYRAAEDRVLHVLRPQARTGVGSVSAEHAVHRTLEHQLAAGREQSAVARARMVHSPHFALSDRIPREQHRAALAPPRVRNRLRIRRIAR